MSKFAIYIFVLMCSSGIHTLAQVAISNSKTTFPSINDGIGLIKLEETIVFDIASLDKATLTVHQVKKILNDNGASVLLFNKYSNRTMQLGNVDIKVFDSTGKQKARYRKSDMATVAYGNGFVDDGMVTYFAIPALSYPMTMAIDYTYHYKGLISYPRYAIVEDGEPVLQSSFTAKVPVALGLRYKSNGINLSPEILNKDQFVFYKWTVNNLPAVQDETNALSKEDRHPSVSLAPNKFRLYGRDGDMSSWKNFGQWEYDLTTNLYNLPSTSIAFFQQMTAGKTKTETIAAVYNYLQTNFRYVSIQLGLGGFRPADAAFTDRKKYGDCKALCFYMHAVLKSVGIESHLALVNAGFNTSPVAADFPSNNFNHMLICIPNGHDSTWLECTSRINDAGFLGNFTEDRQALLIKAGGGELVNTPVSSSSQNVLTSLNLIQLSGNKSAKISTRLISSGYYKEELAQHLTEANKYDQQKFLVNILGFKQPDELSVTTQTVANNFTTTVEFSVDQLPVFTTGNKWFLQSRATRLWTDPLPSYQQRQFDYFFETAFTKTDTTIYHLPEGYTVDVLPQPVLLNSRHATLIVNYEFDQQSNSIYSTTTLQLKQHKIPAADYDAVKLFFDEVMKRDAEQIVIKKL